jgi:polyvinyl alcohol dehydrogenase (cytochrome)
MRLPSVSLFALVSACGLFASSSFAASVSGEAVFKERCASCHDSGSARVPPRDALKKLSVTQILRSLDFGTMNNIAGKLRQEEREAVATYLGVPGGPMQPPAKAYCTDRTVKLASRPKLDWNGWSPGVANTRYQSGDTASLSAAQVPRLKLKWAYGFDGDIIAFSQPTILDGNLFVGSASGMVQALSTESGCVRWVFQAAGPVRSAILAVPLGDKHVLLFGDSNGWFYCLDAETGRRLWSKRPEPHEATRLTGAPIAYNGTVFIPVASWEESRTTNPDYPCCTFRGSVVALHVKDGTQLWKTYMIAEKAKQTGKNQWGPSGADVTTGNNFSAPTTSMSDSVVALELMNGRIVWAKQTLAGDNWNTLCNQKGNCPGPDYDFGAPAILEKSETGRDVLLAGQKSGMVYALDPDRKGEILWQARVGQGGTAGGIEWGMASDGRNVYAASSDAVRIPPAIPDPLDPRGNLVDPQKGGGLTALRITTGEKVWYAAPIVCGPAAKPGCSPAQSAAVTAIPGVVFSGSLDGHLRAYSAQDGKVLWDFDTIRDYQTANGVRASGGSLNGPGPVVVGGMLFVNSGYARLGSTPGNVLLAFALEQ